MRPDDLPPELRPPHEERLPQPELPLELPESDEPPPPPSPGPSEEADGFLRRK